MSETREAKRVIVTAFIAAIVESVRAFGSVGAPENELYASVAGTMDRAAFDMIIGELIEQKTVKREHGCIVYCGPLAL